MGLLRRRKRERCLSVLPDDVRAMVEKARSEGISVPDFDWYYGRTRHPRLPVGVVMPFTALDETQRRPEEDRT